MYSPYTLCVSYSETTLYAKYHIHISSHYKLSTKVSNNQKDSTKQRHGMSVKAKGTYREKGHVKPSMNKTNQIVHKKMKRVWRKKGLTANDGTK